MAMSMTPSVGRIVHVHSSEWSSPQAAIVTHVWNDEGLINANVFVDANASTGPMALDPVIRRTSIPAVGMGNDLYFWEWPPRT